MYLLVNKLYKNRPFTRKLLACEYITISFECLQIFPFVFILTDRKSTKCYEHFFKYINDNVLDLDGATFVTDYEISLRTAIMIVFPKSKVIGCWFHNIVTIITSPMSWIFKPFVKF